LRLNLVAVVNDGASSQNDAWRWDGQQWVPTTAPPPLPPWSPPAGLAARVVPSGLPGSGLVVSALIVGIVGLVTVAIQLFGDTIVAFRDISSVGWPWYYETWFIFVAILIMGIAMVLASVAVLRQPGRFSWIVFAMAAAGLLQGAIQLYYRIIVSHFGYDIPL
jgi:hypothetical protein